MFRNHPTRFVSMPRRVAIAAALALACGTAPALAEVGNADAYNLQVTLSVLGIQALNVAPQAPASIVNVTAAAADSNELPSIDVGTDLVARLRTGLLGSAVEYRPGVSTSAIAGQSQVASLNLSAVGLLGVNVLTLKADAIRSRSVVVGYCPPPGKQQTTNGLLDDLMYGNGFDIGGLDIGGDGSPGAGPDDSIGLTNLSLSILGINVPIPLNPPANTGVDLNALGIAGATLILNEQVIEGDGITSRKKTSNGLRLTLNILGTITGQVIIAHSSAGIDCTH